MQLSSRVSKFSLDSIHVVSLAQERGSRRDCDCAMCLTDVNKINKLSIPKRSACIYNDSVVKSEPSRTCRSRYPYLAGSGERWKESVRDTVAALLPTSTPFNCESWYVINAEARQAIRPDASRARSGPSTAGALARVRLWYKSAGYQRGAEAKQ